MRSIPERQDAYVLFMWQKKKGPKERNIKQIQPQITEYDTAECPSKKNPYDFCHIQYTESGRRRRRRRTRAYALFASHTFSIIPWNSDMVFYMEKNGEADGRETNI